MGLMSDALGEIKQEKADKQVKRAERKAKGGKDPEANPRYSADDKERCHSNTGVVVTEKGEVLLRVATTGPRKGKAPRCLIEASHGAVDALAGYLHELVDDEKALGEKKAEFAAFIASLKK